MLLFADPRPKQRIAGDAGTHPDDSSALVARLRARDPLAARQAWRQLGPLVTGVLRRFHELAPDREDLCQEVFLRFFARIDELRDPRALRGFLLGICLGVAQNQRRRALVRQATALASTDELLEIPVDGADLEARELAGRLLVLLAAADPDDADIFLMKTVEERGFAELAAARGISVSTAKRRMARAVQRIGGRLRADPALGALADRLDGAAAGPRPEGAAGAPRVRG